METAADCLTRPSTMDWFGTHISDHHGNRASTKRPGGDDSRYPPKKRALLEHRARESRNRDNAEDDENVNPSLYSTHVKHETTEMIPRPRSDSLHSNFSGSSENSETMSNINREDSPFLFHNLYDHRTPERHPLRSLNTQVAKPLFTNISNNFNVGEKKFSLHPGNSDIQYGRHGKKSQNALQHPGNLDSQNGQHINKIQNVLQHPVNPEAITMQSKFSTESDGGEVSSEVNSDQTDRETESHIDKSAMMNNATTDKAEQSYSNDHIAGSYGNHDNLKQKISSTGAMVSLLDRFNAEPAAENQSDNQLPVTTVENIPNDSHPVQQTDGTKVIDSQFMQSNSKSNTSADCVTSETSLELSHPLPVTSANCVTGETSQEIFKCPVCSRQIRQRSHFLSHLKTHEDDDCKCRVCGQQQGTLDKLQLHLETGHKGDNCYRCEHCSREFSQYNNLRRHLRVHRANIYKCTLCDREFNEEFYLTMHMASHTGHRVYHCGVCHARFTSSADLKAHVTTHSPSQLHTCPECGKSFSKACVLRQHRKAHSGARPHKCDICSKTFIHRHHLTMHLRSHLNSNTGAQKLEKLGMSAGGVSLKDPPPADICSFTCDICSTNYTDSSQLYEHLSYHDNEDDVLAVKVMKERLEQINSERMNIKGRARKPSRPKVKKKVNPVEDNNFHVSTSQPPERSRSLIAEPAGITSEQKRYNLSLPTSSVPYSSLPHTQAAQPSSVKTSLPAISSLCRKQQQTQPTSVNHAPPGYGLQHYPIPGYNNPVYQAYVAQAHAYFSNMYMMNYMSQNALQHPGNPVNQDGRRGEEKSLNANLHPGNQNGRYGIPCSQLEQTAGEASTRSLCVKTERDKIVSDQMNSLPSPTTVSKKRDRGGWELRTAICEESEEEKRRAVVARQLLFMSNQRTKTTDEKTKGTHQTLTQISTSQSVTKETYVVDQCRTVDFTKCISDVIDKTMKIQHNQTPAPPTIWNPATAETGNQLSKTFKTGIVSSEKSDNKNEALYQAKAENQYFRKSDSGTQSHKAFGTMNQSIIKEAVCTTSDTDCFLNYRLVPRYSRGGTSLDTLPAPPQYSCPKLSYPQGNQDEVLNLSQKKVKSNLDPPNSRNIPPRPILTSLHSNTGMPVRGAWNSPAHIMSCGQQLDQSYQHSPAGPYTSQAQPYRLPHPLTSTQSMPLPSNNGDFVTVGSGEGRSGKHSDSSGKIRRASCHDVGNPMGKALDLRRSNSVMCSRHMSENLTVFRPSQSAGVISHSNKITSHIKANTGELGHKLDHKLTNFDSQSAHSMSMNKSLPYSNYGDEATERSTESGNCNDEAICSENMKGAVQASVKSEDEQSELCTENKNRNKVLCQDNETSQNTREAETDVKEDDVCKESEIVESDVCLESRVGDKEVVTETEVGENEAKEIEVCTKTELYTDTVILTKTKHIEDGVVYEKQKYTLDGVERKSSNSLKTLKDSIVLHHALDKQEKKVKPEKSDILENSDNVKDTNKQKNAETLGKPYECNVCLRRFAQKHNLNRHKMSHSTKSFECSVCQRMFKESFYLQMHMKVHADDDSQTCEICGAEIPRSKILEHTKEHLEHIAKNPTYKQIGGRVKEILQSQDLNMKQGADNNMGAQLMSSNVELVQGGVQNVNPLQEKSQNGKHASGNLKERENVCLKKVRQTEIHRGYLMGRFDNIEQVNETTDTFLKIRNSHGDDIENGENLNIPKTSSDSNEPNGRKVGQKIISQRRGNRLSVVGSVLEMRKFLN